MLVSSQEDLDQAAALGEPLIEIGSRNAFTISGHYSPAVRFVDPSHQCLTIEGQAAPHLLLGEQAACITVTVTGRARPLIDVSETCHPSIEIRETSTPRIQLFGASSSRIECYDDAAPRIEISGSAVLRLRSFNRAHPRVWAHERATVRIQGPGQVFADNGVPIHHDGKAAVLGGVSTLSPAIEAEE